MAIAISYETKIDEIKRLNNLYDNNIYPGEKLLIKQGVTVSTTTPVETPTSAIAETRTTPPTLTATLEAISTPAKLSTGPISASTNTVMSIAIGIITLILLGVIFAGMGDSEKPKTKTKE